MKFNRPKLSDILSDMIDLSDRKNMFYWQTNRPLTAQQTKTIFIDRHESIDNGILMKIIKQGMNAAGFKDKDTEIKKINPIIKQGSVNSVIPVLLESGKEIALRIHPRNVKNGYFWAEKTATDLARKEGVPTYETIYIDDTQETVPFDFMIMTKIKGMSMQAFLPLSFEIEKKLVTQTGTYAAMIHRIKPEGFGFFDNTFAKTDHILHGQYKHFKEHIFAALNDDLEYLVKTAVLTTTQQKRIIQLFQNNVSLMDCKMGSLIHNDIADWNEVSDGKIVTGIMDWDECFSGDPLMEVAAYNLFFGEPRITWFKEGYEQISPLEKNEDKFQLFKLRYLISKMHLRKKRSTIDHSEVLVQNIQRGMKAMEEVFGYFKF